MKVNLPYFQHLYIMFAPGALPWRAKVGISISAKQRKSEIEAQLRPMFGHVRVLCIGIPMLYAYQIEQRIHRIYRRMQYDGIRNTNGGTEWFWSFNVISCLILAVLRYIFLSEELFLLPFIFLLAPLPVDFMLIVGFIAILQWAMIIGVFYLLALNLL